VILVRGSAGGTALTGTVYEREKGEEPPSFRGAPDTNAPYVWVCDEFYEVESGGTEQRIDDETVRLAFEEPTPRGYTSREEALEGAKDHLRTQFARLGLDGDDVGIVVERQESAR